MKKYVLIVYNSGNVLKMVSFDNIQDFNNSELEGIKEVDKIKLFELNKNKDGRDLIKEYRINSNLDNILFDAGTKILKYEVVETFTGTIKFRIIFEMTTELQNELDLWHKKRYIDLRLIQSKQDESIVDVRSAAFI